MKKALPIIIVLVVLVLLGGCSYNGMNAERLKAEKSWAGVQSAYQRRADLIPNLVATVKGAADFEKSTYVEVAKARAGQLSNLVSSTSASEVTPERMQQIQQASAEAGAATTRAINVAFEAYPNLRATVNFADLQNQLEGTENRINVSRDEYNGAVESYNRKVTSFPGNIMAKLFGFREKEMFKSAPGSDKAPEVKF